MITAFATLARRRLRDVRSDGDRGSLVLAMLVTLVATSVAALILPLLLTSADAARYDDRRARQLAAAQSGVETALARIRAAVDATSSGLIGSLPCATLTGTVLGSTDLRYKADVTYFTSDPALLTTTAALTAATVQCATDVVGGVVKNLGTKTTPAFARITGQGTDAPGTAFPAARTRTVTATYVVKTTNSNIVGGLFRVNKLPTSRDLCLDAGSAHPTAGTVVTMRTCSSDAASQKWAYNATLTVSLVSTRTTNSAGVVTSDGMCVDGGAPNELEGTHLRVQPCSTATTLTQQRWNMNDTAGMEGTKADGSDRNGLCWTVVEVDTPGSHVALGKQCGGTNGYDNKVSWQPEAAVGAGASGAAYNELVNYAQFGRCLDVTDQIVTSSYLIAWPCKQNPDPTKVRWNQRWTLPTVTNGAGVGRITTIPDGSTTTYCLTSPLSSAAGKYVTVAPCPTGTTPATQWKVRTQVSSYAASYQIEDTSNGSAAGLCLQPTDPRATPPDLATQGTGISKIVVRPCTASTLQKWNAPPNIDAPSVKDQTER